MKNKNFQSRVCVCTASTNLLCTIKPCRNGEKNAGSENDIIGSIYYNLYSAGYISIDAGRKIGRVRRLPVKAHPAVHETVLSLPLTPA